MRTLRELFRPAAISIVLLITALPCLFNSRADTVYVTDQYYNTLRKFKADGSGSLIANVGPNNLPSGLAFDRAGNLYVANANLSNGKSAILKFTANGTVSVFDTNLNYLNGLAIDGTDTYVVNMGSSTINKFSASGSNSVFATLQYDGYGLAFDGAGNLYVTDYSQNRVIKFTPDSVGSVFANIGLHSPTGIAFDRAGNLYVANAGDNTIRKFSSTGADLGIFASTGLSYPVGMAFDSARNLYVACNGNGSIRKISADGTDLGNFVSGISSGLYKPTFLAIVPDPALDILVSSNQTILSWPVSETNYVLQATTNLASPNWIDSSNQPIVRALRCVLTNSTSADSQFYRLKSP